MLVFRLPHEQAIGVLYPQTKNIQGKSPHQDLAGGGLSCDHNRSDTGICFKKFFRLPAFIKRRLQCLCRGQLVGDAGQCRFPADGDLSFFSLEGFPNVPFLKSFKAQCHDLIAPHRPFIRVPTCLIPNPMQYK